MGCLPFVCAAVAGYCVDAGGYGWAVFAALCAVIFAIAHGAELIADTLEELD